MRVFLRSLSPLGLLTLAALTACGPLRRTGEAAPLTTSPYAFERGDSTMAWRPSATLPPHIGLHVPARRLPDATVNARGSVRALVFPVSFGARLPMWTDSLLAYQVLGSATSPRGAAGRLAVASQGLFRLDASIFPHLIDAHTPPADVAHHTLTTEGMAELARYVVNTWAGRVNLAAFDNDGPDGQPVSGDDDGALDFVVLALETDSTPALARVPMKLDVPVGRDGRLTLAIRQVYVMALPRTGSVSAENLGPTALTLGAMGLELDEMFFPEGFERSISTLARLRLGWIAGLYAGRSGSYALAPDQALVIPIVDVHDNRGHWLVERVGGLAYLTRIVRKANGHFATIETRRLEAGQAPTIIPLTQTEGASGPRARLRWMGADQPLELRIALSPRAIEDDERARDLDQRMWEQLERERIARADSIRDAEAAAARRARAEAEAAERARIAKETAAREQRRREEAAKRAAARRRELARKRQREAAQSAIAPTPDTAVVQGSTPQPVGTPSGALPPSPGQPGTVPPPPTQSTPVQPIAPAPTANANPRQPSQPGTATPGPSGTTPAPARPAPVRPATSQPVRGTGIGVTPVAPTPRP